MRFDDRLTTLLRGDASSEGAMAAQWSQLVDVLAQDRGQLSDADRQAVLLRLESLKPKIAVSRRTATARAVAVRCTDAALVTLLGDDMPQIAAPILLGAQLNDDAWGAVIAALPPASRALLRERRDLPQSARTALQSYGPRDFALPSQEPGGDQAEALQARLSGHQQPAPGSQISELMARIDNWQKARPVADQDARRNECASPFRFETDSDGRIDWAEGEFRAALIGLSIAELPLPLVEGVDGQVAGAVAKRTRFRDGRLVIAGTGAMSGPWLVSGDPLFEPADGRFIGYRGIGRRPRAGEAIAGQGGGMGLSGGAIRQVVHELRTPLNAIQGFSEMIHAQIVGPVGQQYRQRAESIALDSRRLLALIEDVDAAARPVEQESDPRCQLEDIVGGVLAELHPVARANGVTFAVDLDGWLPDVAVAPATAHRLIMRLCAVLADLSPPGCTIDLHARAVSSGVEFASDRPVSEANLADGNDSSTDFTLRLLQTLALQSGGSFRAGQRLTLILPMATASVTGATESR